MDDKEYIQKNLIYKLLIDTQIHLSDNENEDGKIARAKWELIDSLYEDFKNLPSINIEEINNCRNRLYWKSFFISFVLFGIMVKVLIWLICNWFPL